LYSYSNIKKETERMTAILTRLGGTMVIYGEMAGILAAMVDLGLEVDHQEVMVTHSL
jgi:hypothetical protein